MTSIHHDTDPKQTALNFIEAWLDAQDVNRGVNAFAPALLTVLQILLDNIEPTTRTKNPPEPDVP